MAGRSPRPFPGSPGQVSAAPWDGGAGPTARRRPVRDCLFVGDPDREIDRARLRRCRAWGIPPASTCGPAPCIRARGARPTARRRPSRDCPSPGVPDGRSELPLGVLLRTVAGELFLEEPAEGVLERLASRLDVRAQGAVDHRLVAASARLVRASAEPVEYLVVETDRDPRLARRCRIDRAPFALAEVVPLFITSVRTGAARAASLAARRSGESSPCFRGLLALCESHSTSTQ